MFVLSLCLITILYLPISSTILCYGDRTRSRERDERILKQKDAWPNFEHNLYEIFIEIIRCFLNSNQDYLSSFLCMCWSDFKRFQIKQSMHALVSKPKKRTNLSHFKRALKINFYRFSLKKHPKKNENVLKKKKSSCIVVSGEKKLKKITIQYTTCKAPWEKENSTTLLMELKMIWCCTMMFTMGLQIHYYFAFTFISQKNTTFNVPVFTAHPSALTDWIASRESKNFSSQISSSSCSEIRVNDHGLDEEGPANFNWKSTVALFSFFCEKLYQRNREARRIHFSWPK